MSKQIKVIPSYGQEVEILSAEIESHLKSHKENAFYCVDLGDVVSQMKLWREELPRVRPFYAIKSNPEILITQIIASMGGGFDCATKGEMMLAKATFDKIPHRLNNTMSTDTIFANTFKFVRDIEYAKSVGIAMATYDSLGELQKLHEHWPDVKLVLRILPAKTYEARCALGNKFGTAFKEVNKLLDKTKELNMNVVGVSFHVGSACGDTMAWAETIEFSKKSFELMREKGFNPYLLDIGGGFPGSDEQGQRDFRCFARALSVPLDQHFPPNENYTIIAEPGRFFCAGAYTLCTQVIGKHGVECYMDGIQITREDDDDSVRYIVNDGLYGSFNNIVFDHARPLPWRFYRSKKPELTRMLNDTKDKYFSRIYGPTCDGFDCVLSNSVIPALKVNDWILWRDMGAYTVASGSTFNSIPMPDINFHISDSMLQELLQEEGTYASKAELIFEPGCKPVERSHQNSSSEGKTATKKMNGTDILLSEPLTTNGNSH